MAALQLATGIRPIFASFCITSTAIIFCINNEDIGINPSKFTSNYCMYTFSLVNYRIAEKFFFCTTICVLTFGLDKKVLMTKDRLMIVQPYRVSSKKNIDMSLCTLKNAVRDANITAMALTTTMIPKYTRDQDSL